MILSSVGNKKCLGYLPKNYHVIKIIYFRGDLTDVTASTAALVRSPQKILFLVVKTIFAGSRYPKNIYFSLVLV